MTNKREFPTWFYEGALLLTTVVWGSSFVVLKGALDIIPAAWLLALRFGLAAAICTLLFWRRLQDNLDGSHLIAGALIGLSGGAAYLVQNIGLEVTTPGKNAFLTATYCVMVPFLYWIIGHKRPGVHNVVASLLCIVGVALIAMGGVQGTELSGMLSFNEGDALTLVAAFLFAVNIVLIAYFAPAHDVGTLTVVQLYVFTGLCAVVGFLTQSLPTASVFTSDLIAKLAYLVLVCTVFAIASQNFAQKHVEPSHAALLMSFESVFGVMFSVLVYHEIVTPAMFLGFAAIFISVLISELMGGQDDRNNGMR
jgi:drug/metabolite transporter (DMT)-like permease